jgi:serine/threonine-protein kinase HipA
VKSFDPREYPELTANEYFCLRAAALAGIPTANARLSVDRRLLVVRRFDQDRDGRYLGCEDFCVLSALRSHERYEGSYEGLARRVGQFVSPAQVPLALETLFAIVALSCAIENGDAHLKNFAVLYEHPEASVRLAPAYDLVSTTPYQRRDVLALSLGRSRAFPQRSALVQFGRTACALSQARVNRILARVRDGVQAALVELATYAANEPDFRTAAASFRAAFERGLARSIAPRR